ncbi:MAG: 50S ribosomal protein L35 [Planctomycetes bacterium]|jgi:large subunit ribosomal protein L35|nr:50S ribosomal protein L35 [Planctomycetota bacterium]MDP6423332.1 50S ribosomal protein L35 [Planctomycetota bacterium]
MPKAKTCKAVAKRMKLTKTGKVKRGHANTSHMLVRRSRKQKRNLRKAALVVGLQAKTMRTLLGG